MRLDVAVHDAARVGVVERLAEVGADLADLAVAERPFAGQVGEGRALDQLGDEQRVAVLLAHLIERDDPRVVEPRRRLRLAQHPPAGLTARLDRLDRDGALEPPVPGLVDDAEAAAADAALDQKAVEHEGTDQDSSEFAAIPLPPATYSLLLGGFHRIPAGAPRAPATPSRTAADPAQARAGARRRPAGPDPDRARRARLPRRAQAQRAQQLRRKRRRDRRRRPSRRASASSASSRTPASSRSPSSSPRSTPTAARWTTTSRGSTRSTRRAI